MSPDFFHVMEVCLMSMLPIMTMAIAGLVNIGLNKSRGTVQVKSRLKSAIVLPYCLYLGEMFGLHISSPLQLLANL
jgi:hypothetical protein